jgi:uncharacterized protein YkwD
MRRRYFLAAVPLLLAGCLPTPAPKPAPGVSPVPAPSAAAAPLVAAINAERARAGLTALAEDPAASRLAASWAESMAAAQVMVHGNFGDRIARVFPGRAAGEDIAAGQPDVASVVRSWMDSPPHRANILGPFTTIGVGEGTSKSNYVYWCVDFIR